MPQLLRLILGLGLLLPATALAQVNVDTPSSVRNFTSLGDLIQRVFNITVGVSGVIFVGLLLLGGVLYLTSLGNEDGVTKARKTMINAAIGLVIVVSSWAIGNFVLQLLGIRVLLNGVSSVQTPVGTVQSSTPAQTSNPSTTNAQTDSSTPSTTFGGAGSATTTTDTTKSSTPSSSQGTQTNVGEGLIPR